MACVNCNKIRAAILHGKMAEAAGLTVEVLRKKIGFKTEVPQLQAVDGAVVEEEPTPKAKAK